jgi:putative membrane-bound dehydrogenase-like protein
MRFNGSLCIVALAAFVFISSALSAAETVAKPNIIVMMVDDMGFAGPSIAPYSNPHYKTPGMDQLASEGMLFTDFHASGAICSATRAGLITGRYQQRAGIEAVIHPHATHPEHRKGLHETEVTFAELFKDAGYSTGLVGKWHLGYAAETPKYHPMNHGFDYFMGYVSGNIDYINHWGDHMKHDWWHGRKETKEEGYTTHLINKYALEFIEQNKDKSFCLYIAHESPHSPVQGPDDPIQRGPGAKKRSTPHAEAMKQMILEMDKGVEQVRAKLVELGLENNTLFLFFSDNGDAPGTATGSPRFRGHKGSVYEGGTRVPAIAWWPGRIKAGTQAKDLSITLDVMPTILSVAGIDPPKVRPFDGIDLSPVLFKQEPLPHRPLFWANLNNNGSRSEALRDGPWKLVVQHPKAKPGTFGNEAIELFNLTNDEREKTNLAAQQSDLAAEMLNRIKAWYADTQKTASPQPGGWIPKPRGDASLQPTLAKSAGPFIVAEGLNVESFAADQLSNPASIDVDDRGRVWVAEALNYRKKTRKQGDRILILEDSDGDGRADRSRVFYQNPDIDGVHGVCVLGNKAIVSAPDRIIVLTDTDGDDKADEKNLLFKGKVMTGLHGQHDHAIHAAMFGPDGRLYFNFGNHNAELRRADGTLVKDVFGNPVNNSRQPYQEGMVIRCELDGSRVEVLGHNFRNNWEVTVDSFGSMWQSDNDNGSSSCRVNFVMEYGNYGYRDEKTGADYGARRTNMEATMQRQMWHQNDPGVVPNLLITGSGAPTGILVYEGDLLPAPFHGQMIHAEPGRNRVWAFPTQQAGAGYSTHIVDLARSDVDRDYRPSDISVAPDGSLFIADWFDPVDCCHRTINDAGRIFRVAPPGNVYSNPTYNYETPKGAVFALRSPNLAARYKAWTALLRMGAAARPALQTLIEDPNPRLRARGLWVLAAIADTPRPAIEIAVSDDSNDIRALALRIARRHQLPVEAIVKRLVHDKAALVRRECAVSLHRLDSAEAELWTELAIQYDGKDRWYLEALGIGEVGNETACLNAWRKRVGEKWKTAGNLDIVWRSRAPEAATLLAELMLDSDVPATEHPRLMRALDFHDGQHRQAALNALLTSAPKRNPVVWLEAFQRASPEYLEAHPDISDQAGSVMLSSKGTVTFVALVARFDRRDMISHLMDMAQATPESEAGIRAVAQIIAFEDWDPIWKALADPTRSEPFIKALGYVNSVHAKNYLTDVVTNESQPEATRLLAISAMGNSRPQALELKRLVEQKALPQEFMAPAVRTLTLSPDPDTRMYAASQRDLLVPVEGRWPLEKLLATQPDSTKGFAAFQKGGCIKCHKIGDLGKDFGPDLSAIGTKLTSKQLFEAILNPSQTISLGYEGVLVVTDEGKLHSGFVSAETKDTLSLRIPGGLRKDILKINIELREPMKVSAMPAGIDAVLLPRELVDVVGWLRTGRAKKPLR